MKKICILRNAMIYYLSVSYLYLKMQKKKRKCITWKIGKGFLIMSHKYVYLFTEGN